MRSRNRVPVLRIVALCVVLLAGQHYGKCEKHHNSSVTSSADDVWDAIKTSGDGIVKLMKPILDNEIVKESQDAFDAKIVQPINETVQENRRRLDYESSSMQRLQSDVTLINKGIVAIRKDVNRTMQAINGLKIQADSSEVLLNKTSDDVSHLKKKISNLTVSVDDNTKLLAGIDSRVKGIDSRVKEAIALVNSTDEAVRTLNGNIQDMDSKLDNITAILTRHNWTQIA